VENRIGCSVKEAASTIGCCENTIYRHIREGRLHSTKLGKRRIVDVESLRRLVVPHTVIS